MLDYVPLTFIVAWKKQAVIKFIIKLKITNCQILRRRIREGKALLEKNPFLPHKEAVLGHLSSLLNQNRHFLICF